MQSQKYSVNQHLIETVLTWVKSGEIAIPEIQRPFVWNATKVRDLMESLYEGYPIGYLITWKSPNVRLKDGSLSDGKKILIDGQQRVTAMTAAILGEKIVDQDYKKKRIQIAFHPLDGKFEVNNPAIENNVEWIPDISPIICGEISLIKRIRDYCQKNPLADEEHIETVIQRLQGMVKKQLGIIELSGDLDIETVTEIFVRINSQGVRLSEADFAMSKIASKSEYGGPELRKCIDYFCHLVVSPDFYAKMSEVDEEFVRGEYYPHLRWLKDENDDLYDPNYNDVIRVSFVSEFNRGKLSDLVGLLSGRNFETRTYEESIAEETFTRLKNSLFQCINETNFHRFIMIIRSIGFIDKSMINSGGVLNFAYIVYLKLRSLKYPPEKIERFVRRWFVLSILTARYSGSTESKMDFDIKKIGEDSIEKYIDDVERAELSEAFWSVGLVQNLNSSISSSPYFHVYLAAQVKNRDKGFLSREITVEELIRHRGDIHHLFPRDYLKKQGKQRREYNQIANYVYMQSETNIKIGNKEPREYFTAILNQVKNGSMTYGAITEHNELLQNLDQNCIPHLILEADVKDYEVFVQQRRELIAKRIKEYYQGL